MTLYEGRARWLGTIVAPAGMSVCVWALLACTSGGEPPAPSASASPSPSLPFVIPTPPLSVVETGNLSGVGTVPWQFAVRVDDRTLDIRYIGSKDRCRVLANVRVKESASEVTITVYLGTPPDHAVNTCTSTVGIPARTRIPLASPLGDRRVIDGATRPPEERDVRNP